MKQTGQRTSRVRTLGLLAAIPLALGILNPPAGAEPPQVQDAKLVVVLDASAAMLEPESFRDAPRIDALRAAVSGSIADLDPGDQVGLRVFGATVAGPETRGACEDSQLVVPIGADNRDELTAGVERYTPLGEAPIAFALHEAYDDLGGDGQRTILLISDGESNCDPNPCAAARELAAADINLTINVVGMADDDAAARLQLQCIADAGHGTYFGVQDAGTLAAAIDRLAARAFLPFPVTGTPVEGTPTPDGAPELAPGGQYTDFVGAVDDPRYYLIRRTLEGSSVHVGLTASLGRVPKRTEDAYGSAELELSGVDGDWCWSSDADGVDGPWALITLQVSYFADPDDLAGACLDDDVLVLSVTMTGWVDEIVGTPYELVISEEPPVAPDAVLQDAAEFGQFQWQPMTADGAAGTVFGGSSLNDAPTIAPGSYAADILPGETVVVRVPVEWGQWLQAQADFAVPSSDLSAIVDSGLDVYMTVISPTRGEATDWMAGTDMIPSDWLLPSRPTHVASGNVPVRWWNRAEITSSASVPGDYYVAISVAEDPNNESVVIPFTLTLGVFGTAGQGAPPYDTTPGTDSSSGTAVIDMSTVPTADSLATAQVNTPDDGRADDEGMSPLLVAAFGIAGVGLVGRGAYLLRRNARAAR